MVTKEAKTEDLEQGFSIYDIEDIDEDITDKKSNSIKMFGNDLYRCKCCGSNQRLHKEGIESKGAKRGVIELLYIARINKQDVRICPRCVATAGYLLHNNAEPVLVYDYASGKFRADINKIKKATGTIDDSENLYY